MINRRNFIRLVALSTEALAFRPLNKLALPEFPQSDRLGRIAVGKMDVFATPDGSGQPIGALYEDQVVSYSPYRTHNRVKHEYDGENMNKTL